MPSAWWYQQRLRRWLSWKTFRGPLKTLGLLFLALIVLLAGMYGWVWYWDGAGPRPPAPAAPAAATLIVVAPLMDGVSVTLDGAALPRGEVVRRLIGDGAHELQVATGFSEPRTVNLTVAGVHETWLVTAQEQCFLVLNMREVMYGRARPGESRPSNLNPWGKRPDVIQRMRIDGAQLVRGDLAWAADELPRELQSGAKDPLFVQQIPCELYERTDKEILIDDMGFRPWSP